MKSIYYFVIPFTVLLFVLPSCGNKKIDSQKYGNCTDDKQNQNEEGVDCGGVCSPCSSCNDGVKNSNETGIDCGGGCISCVPSCSITPATSNYTLFPPSFTFSLSGTESVYSAYYSNVNSDITVDLTNGLLTSARIEFKDSFDPISYIPLNTTMVFKTLSYSTFNISNINEVKVTFYGNINFSSYSTSILAGELIYITKISNTSVQIRFCNIAGGSGTDRFNLNAST
jgi:hypothetical protein